MEIEMKFKDEDINKVEKILHIADYEYAMWELQKYVRNLRKGYTNDEIIVNGDRVLENELISKQVTQTYAKDLKPEEIDETLPPFKDNKAYIGKESVINELDRILDIVRNLLD